MIKFTTNDRYAVDFNGNMNQIPWSAICENYKADHGVKKLLTLKQYGIIQKGIMYILTVIM